LRHRGSGIGFMVKELMRCRVHAPGQSRVFLVPQPQAPVATIAPAVHVPACRMPDQEFRSKDFL
jgi:hypothetical protein